MYKLREALLVIWADEKTKYNSMELTATILLMRDPSSKRVDTASIALTVDFHHKQAKCGNSMIPGQ